MTYSDYKKAFKQLQHKQIKYKKYIKHNSPKDRKYGFTTKTCKRCGQHRAHIGKYGINLCRVCFREIAINLGFKKYN